MCLNTRIYLVRHGETAWNASGKFQGHSDVPLSDRGKEQAKAIAQRLALESIDSIYCSDLSRASETADIIAQPHNLKVTSLAELREINFGKWEGLTFDEISEKYGELSTNWWTRPLTTQIPSGERLQEVVKRCSKAINSIVTSHSGETVVVVAHGGIIRLIVGIALGLDLNSCWKLRIDNVSLTILEYYGLDKVILVLHNDNCHLTSK